MKRIIVASNNRNSIDSRDIMKAASVCRILSEDEGYANEENRRRLRDASNILEDAVNFYMYSK